MILGNFSTVLNRSVITHTRKSCDEPDPFIAELENRRVGIINGLQETDVINAPKFKTLASNEKYTYRKLFSNKIEKTGPRHVIFVESNYYPRFAESDDSIWERLIVFNFRARFTDIPSETNEFILDSDLFTKLSHEKEAILKWMVEGSVRYFAKEKLDIPTSNLEALQYYKNICQSHYEAYFYSRLRATQNESDRIQVSLLNSDYKNWCAQNEIEGCSTRKLTEFLHRKGINKKKNNNTYYTNVVYK